MVLREEFRRSLELEWGFPLAVLVALLRHLLVVQWVCHLVVRVVQFLGLRLVFLVDMACRRMVRVERLLRQRLRRVLLADLDCLLVVLAERLP